GEMKVLYRFSDARGVGPNGRACRNGANATMDGEWFRNAAKQMESHPTRRLGIARHPSAGEQRLHLRSEPQGAAVVRVVQGLDSKGIPREQQPALLCIPDCKSKHAA